MTIKQIFFDSRNRASGTPSNCTFVLNKSLHRISAVQVRSFSFSNTLFNVDESQNQLFITKNNGVLHKIAIPVKFYTSIEFVAAINIVFRSIGATADVVVLRENSLIWGLPPSWSINQCPMSDIIGIRVPYISGLFISQLSLSSPSAISLVCNEFQPNTERITCSRSSSGVTPLLIHHLQRGYNNMEVFEPQVGYFVDFALRDTGTLSFALVDPTSNRICDEVGGWSLILNVSSE